MASKKPRVMQKFNRNWMEDSSYKAWLRPSNKGDYFAFCTFCNTDLSIGSAGKNDLFRHTKTNKHVNSSPGGSSSQTLLTDLISNKNLEPVKRGEILLAAFIAEHNIPMNIMEHLPQLIKNMCPDSQIAKSISCDRTKTTAIVKNVTGITAKQMTIEKLQKLKFSLIVDESTDRGCVKHLCIVARFFERKVEDAFVCLIPLEEANAEKLHKHIKNFLSDNNIPMENLIGFAADGANTMMGQHNSLSSRLVAENPHLFVLKCVCHSFHLCASYACLKLSREPETLIRDIYNYFNNSPKRIGILKEFQQFLDLKPHKILHPAQTRWLSLRAAVCRILEQYGALKLYFTETALTDHLNADSILFRLKNPYNKLYLEFLEFSLEIFNNMNKLMQSERPQIHKMHENMVTVFKTLLECYMDDGYVSRTEVSLIQIDNPRHYKPIDDLYLGAKVSASLVSTTLHQEDIKAFKLKCLDFFIEGAKQVKKRYNFSNDVFKQMQFLDPQAVKSRRIDSLVTLAVKFPNLISRDELQQLDTEWRFLRNNKDLAPDDSQDLESYWYKVTAARDPANYSNQLYPTLSKFVFAILSLPHSSAAVERIFSSINLIKTKQRNRLNTDTIEGLLHTKQLIGGAKPCYSLEVDNKLLSKFNKNMYS
ncbi:unnamed protein product [Parnassius mnemosyne]|uniref:HAT C-terminal dimerisation domain-containing protein n=1 Tax=Parnassius mnemosyne TaxID=213953 RepID=A0AAV1LUI8_9NEOP